MKNILLLPILILLIFRLTYAEESADYDAQMFAEEYADEVSAPADEPAPSQDYPKEEPVKLVESNTWKFDITSKFANAYYEEDYQPISSHWSSFFSEACLDVSKESFNDVRTDLGISFGQSVTGSETWYVDGLDYQTNDMDFYRFNVKADIGKILYSDRSPNLRVIPYIGYGFRLVGFERTNFNILSIVTSNEVVSEKYYIHHLDVGIKFDNKLNAKWGYSGLGAFGYAISDTADNNSLGKIAGGGGYLVDGNLNIVYYLNDSWKFKLGGFVELQKLQGGETAEVIWPDNDLDIYGGNIAAECHF